MNGFLTEPRSKIALCGGVEKTFLTVYILVEIVFALFLFLSFKVCEEKVFFCIAQFHGVGIDLIDPK